MSDHDKNARPPADWWRGAVVYQVYPRSFLDTNDDGVGDLPGIIEKLDYIAGLGIDAIWVSPFFKSPMRDFGYDVSDYRDVDPLFGTLDDCDRLIEGAHQRGVKVIFDLVLSHTSDQHEWFRESRQSRDNPKSDWYVWADPRPDGSPPNNWQAFFGGPSWTYDVRRGQYYQHNFLSSQPDLNMHNPVVQQAALDVFKFWLDRGVDGFRLDVANCYMHDPQLRDNPPSPDPSPQFFNIAFPTPFTMQEHIYDFSRPENLAFIEKIRTLLDRYENRMTVAEIAFNRDCTGVAVDYTNGTKRFHTAYNFTLISGNKASASFIKGSLDDFQGRPGDAWPSWGFSNHDTVRVMSRWGGKQLENEPRFAKVLFALLCSLRGTAFTYQGEELGLPDAEIPLEYIQDPWGIFLYPHWQGRDGCRTPMPWDDALPHAGFSNAAQTWLPVALDHYPLSVARQERDPGTMLHFVRDFLAWRKTQLPLIIGEINFIDDKDDDALLFVRYHGDQALFCGFNFTAQEKEFTLPEDVNVRGKSLLEAGGLNGDVDTDGRLTLPPFGLYYGALS